MGQPTTLGVMGYGYVREDGVGAAGGGVGA